jgi:hypothetical protein
MQEQISIFAMILHNRTMAEHKVIRYKFSTRFWDHVNEIKFDSVGPRRVCPEQGGA